jgi:hypothetical protein
LKEMYKMHPKCLEKLNTGFCLSQVIDLNIRWSLYRNFRI